MALLETKLASGLDNPPRETVAEAAADFADAYAEWFTGATGLLITTVTGAIKIARDALCLILAGDPDEDVVGWSADAGNGTSLLLSGLAAFWTAVGVGAATLFTGATAASPPPKLAEIPAALAALGLVNDKEISNKDAMAEFAGVLHTKSEMASWATPAGPVTIA